jgi:carboxypeptidase PM20D1
VNFRILPGDSIERVTQHIKTVVNDERVIIEIAGEAVEPSAISDARSAAFQSIATAVREIFPDTLVAPALLIASTDTKHYATLVDNVYRFRPLWVANEDVKRFHGVNERISAENLAMMGRFYARLMTNL